MRVDNNVLVQRAGKYQDYFLRLISSISSGDNLRLMNIKCLSLFFSKRVIVCGKCFFKNLSVRFLSCHLCG